MIQPCERRLRDVRESLTSPTLPIRNAVSQATLLVIQGVDQGARFEIDEDVVGLGRGVHNAVRIHDTEVSRAHARIERVEGKYRLTDLHSSNGTFVNGAPLNTRTLVGGEEIQL